jgi:NIPSNAP
MLGVPLQRVTALGFGRARASFSTALVVPIVEIREYEIKPQNVADFSRETVATSALRQSLTPLRFFSFPETGGKLHVATHGYFYAGGHAERDATRSANINHPEWKEYIQRCRPHVDAQYSTIYQEATSMLQRVDIPGLAEVISLPPSDKSTGILEFRKYQLQLGYDTVPRFLELYETGLRSKLHAPATDPKTRLVTVLFSDNGSLNQVIELWYHGAGTLGMERSRVAARKAAEWRQAIASIAQLAQHFTSTIHVPTIFSPIR